MMQSIMFCSFHLGLAWEAQLRNLAKTFRPGLIIIDTATPALNIIDENDNAEASKKIKALRATQADAANETAILILKHAKTYDEIGHRRSVRGAKAWLGAVDIVMYHSFGVGRPKKQGLRPTFLEADKPRAFGLDHIVKILPHWTSSEEPRGLVLSSTRHSASPPTHPTPPQTPPLRGE